MYKDNMRIIPWNISWRAYSVDKLKMAITVNTNKNPPRMMNFELFADVIIFSDNNSKKKKMQVISH